MSVASTGLPFSNLETLRIGGFLSQTDSEKLLHAFVMSKLDYCNYVYGSSKQNDPQIQNSVLSSKQDKKIRRYQFSPPKPSLVTCCLQNTIQNPPFGFQSTCWSGSTVHHHCQFITPADLSCHKVEISFMCLSTFKSLVRWHSVFMHLKNGTVFRLILDLLWHCSFTTPKHFLKRTHRICTICLFVCVYVYVCMDVSDCLHIFAWCGAIQIN